MKKGKKYFPLRRRGCVALFFGLLERHALAHDRVILLERHLHVGELLLVLGGPDDMPRSRGFHLDEVILRHTGHYTLRAKSLQTPRLSPAFHARGFILGLMKPKARWLAGALTIIFVAVFFGTLAFATVYVPQQEVPVPEFTLQVSEDDLPSKLRIPSLAIESDIEHAGILSNGNMAAPKKFANGAWYKYGTVPGMTGSAVIVGHLDNGLGLKGAFFNLSEIQPGAEIEVETKTGKQIRFTVLRTETYPYDQLPDSVFRDESGAYLNLITCAGKWIYDRRSGMTYDKRVVVYAVRSDSSEG